LLTLDPGNSNILFHCGACCINIPGSEMESITYLKEAVSGVTLDYKEQSPKESGSPVMTYFMLGRSYHLNNEFSKAIENYERYLEAGVDEDPLQLEYTRLQIDACGRAPQVVMDQPSFEFESVLDHFDDDLPSCNNPVISGDGNILIFLVDYPNDKKIMMTRRSGNIWSRPKVINSEIGMVGETSPVCLSYDGEDLYLVHHFYSHSDIFVSRFEGGRWTEAEPLGHNVNGRTSETHASISKDGNTLYFTSDARGGQGSYDIYVSRLDEKGEWGIPTNLGPMINTPYEEHTPFISSNDSILFFSSQGHHSIGGIDVFYSELGPGGHWGEPKNLGYPVNTTKDNVFFNPGWNELDGYYAVQREDDPTSNTINMVIELEPVEEVAEAVQPDPEAVQPDSEAVQPDPEAVQPDSEEVPSDSEDVQPDPGEMTTSEQQLIIAMDQQEVIQDDQEESGTASYQVEATGQPVESRQEITLDEVIEPAETDEILEVLNKGVVYEAETIQPVPVAGATRIQTAVPFDHNAIELGMAAMLEVEKISDVMQSYPETNVWITGHADATGSSDYNMLLSHQRAEQISQYLEMHGIDPSRVSLEGKGESAPVARNTYADGTDAPLGRYLNRQVKVTIVSPESIQVELAGFYVPSSLKPSPGDVHHDGSSFGFTIQVFATLTQVDRSQFKGLTDMEEHICRDDYFRYTYGAYRTFDEAKAGLKNLQHSGHPDAFIQTLDWYKKATE
ncbi:MAG: OmpA family protein, partial [Bacteroidales bacterium]|nr:OmpA family protein [Bacteroidales bacterium]